MTTVSPEKLITDFWRFHEKNPHVYELFVRFTLQAAARRPYFSARTVLHRIRWETTIETDDPKGFKVANAWSPFYSRMFERDYPKHKGFFRKCESIADLAALPGDPEKSTGTHDYPGVDEDGFRFTSDCANGCGCWMGGTRSGGPDGISPFGECPNASGGVS